nr:YchJ family protein [Longispora albida]
MSGANSLSDNSENPRNGSPSSALCPCGLGEAYENCCGRFHTGQAAPTAELLMRSRYSAFAVRDEAYLLRSWHSSTRPRRVEFDPGTEWIRLIVLGTTGGALFDAEGTVEFQARYVEDGQRSVLRENSQFVRENGQWVYLGPVTRGAPAA